MIEVLVFGIALVLSWSNGFFAASLVEKEFKLQLTPLYMISGIVITTLAVFFGRLIGISFFAIFLMSILLLIYQIKNRTAKITWPKKNLNFLTPVLFILITIFILGSIGFFQGYRQGGLIFFNENAHDGFWHIALQRSLMLKVPPENPIYSGQILTGYHYFADLYWAYLAAVSNLKPEITYLVFLPFFLPALFVTSSLLLFSQFSQDRKLIYFTTAILTCGSGLAFFVPFFFPGGSTNQSSFWLDQPVNYIINPHLLLSFSLINVLFFMYVNGIRRWKILFAILLASLVAIKVYAFLVLIPSFGLLSLLRVIQKKDWELFGSLLLTLPLAVVLIFASKVNNGFPFIFEPGWFIKSMFESSDHLNASWWEMQRQVYAQSHNLIHLTVHWIYGFVIFIFGNYGLKILGLLFLPALLLRSKKELSDQIFLYLSIILFSILPTLLFLQKGVVWSSIQFMHFAQLPLCVLVLIGSAKLNKKLQYLFLGLILLFSLPTTFTAFANVNKTVNYISYSRELISGLNSFGQLDIKETILATEYQDSSLVPAISGKAVFMADPNMLGILQINYDQRASYLNEVVAQSLCPQNNVLLTLPASTTSGRIMFQNQKLKIVKCNQ